MKKNLILFFISTIIISFGCSELDLNPLDKGSSENWYSNETQIVMSLNHLYNLQFWQIDQDASSGATIGDYEWWSDYWVNRDKPPANISGAFDASNSQIIDRWKNKYSAIASANQILSKLPDIKEQLNSTVYNRYEAEARFIRACQYGYLITHWGDVPYYTEPLLIDEAFLLSRIDKSIILENIYEDFDFAIAHLPVGRMSDGVERATQGAAMSMKARYALYMGDFEIAANAAKAVIDLGEYELFHDFGELFLSKTKSTKEIIFRIPRSRTHGVLIPTIEYHLPKYVGGSGPTSAHWDFVNAFLCIDGLPIHKSPLYDPSEPFKNRDPRMSATLVEPGTPFLGYIFQPHPDSTKILELASGNFVNNPDRLTETTGNITGIPRRKGIDEDWIDGIVDTDQNIIRYADVLLIYAEAKIELNQIDQSVLNAINQVRARAYGVSYTDTDSYPSVTSMDQSLLRQTVRTERRVEFANEGLRLMDLVRWRLAEKIFNITAYVFPRGDNLYEKIIDPGLWFFPGIPEIDEDGISDFTPWYNAGLIIHNSKGIFTENMYLWPIPYTEIAINPNIKQNPGY